LLLSIKVYLDGNAWIRESDVHDTWEAARGQALSILEKECEEAKDRLFYLQSEFERVNDLKP
jgi:hypothetical protein